MKRIFYGGDIHKPRYLKPGYLKLELTRRSELIQAFQKVGLLPLDDPDIWADINEIDERQRREKK